MRVGVVGAPERCRGPAGRVGVPCRGGRVWWGGRCRGRGCRPGRRPRGAGAEGSCPRSTGRRPGADPLADDALHDDDPLPALVAEAYLVADADGVGGLHALAVDADVAALAGGGAHGAGLDQTDGPDPAVDADALTVRGPGGLRRRPRRRPAAQPWGSGRIGVPARRGRAGSVVAVGLVRTPSEAMPPTLVPRGGQLRGVSAGTWVGEAPCGLLACLAACGLWRRLRLPPVTLVTVDGMNLSDLDRADHRLPGLPPAGRLA
jgi:hypothetical protein